MILVRNCSFSGLLISSRSRSRSHCPIETITTRCCKIISREVYHLFFGRNIKTTIKCFSSDSPQVAEIFQNKVLMAAAASAAIGQLSKPFTSILLNGANPLDFKAAFRAGGFPSTHSSAVVAAATTLGLQRGFSDPVFGLAVVYACLIMYDAQGVRREVGIHAKALNRAFSRNKLNQISSVPDATVFKDSFSGESTNSKSHEPLSPVKLKPAPLQPSNTSLFLESDDTPGSTCSGKTSGIEPGGKRKLESDSLSRANLKESVGHTEIEVLAGALLGFFVSLAVSTG